MATREKKGASGKLQLKYSFFETASGHEESTRDLSLVGHDEKVHLVDHQSSLKMFKNNPSSEFNETWEASVEDLKDLLTIIFGPIITLLGAVTRFYYGEKSNSSH